MSLKEKLNTISSRVRQRKVGRGALELGLDSKETTLWTPEESKLSYNYPIKCEGSLVEEGLKIAAIEPAEKTAHQLGSFIVSSDETTHFDQNAQAIDFLVPIGTEVVLARGGEIIKCVMGNTEHGYDESFEDEMNVIIVQHEDNEYSMYAHISDDSLPKKIEKGFSYPAGTIIGTVDLNGRTDRPHLHFVVYHADDGRMINGEFVTNPHGIKSVTPKFQE